MELEDMKKQAEQLLSGIEETKAVLYRQQGAVQILNALIAEEEKPEEEVIEKKKS